MARLDLEEKWAVAHLRESVRDSLRSHGEECILFSMYRTSRHQNIVPRCPDCYDEIYAGKARPDCTRCWGTSFDGGIFKVNRAWAIFTGADNDETQLRTGVWSSNKRDLQTESYPELDQHDYVARVESWTRDHRPRVLNGIWITGVVDVVSLRTGGVFNDYAKAGVGQRTQIDRVPEDQVIYQYPIIGQRFDRIDGKER